MSEDPDNKLEVAATQDSVDNRYMEFRIGQQEFAIKLLDVLEVTSVPELTPMPKMPKHFLGLMNLRGHVISVIDIARDLGIKPDEEGEDRATIIISLDGITVGFIVDSVNRVYEVDPNNIENDFEVVSKRTLKHANGIYKDGKKLIVLLNCYHILGLKPEEQQLKRSA